jgi:hypothetical protein
MADTNEIPHADGTTTVIEVDGDGNFYVYTIDSATGDRIDNGPSAEIGSSYTLSEVMASYQRADDPSGGPDSEAADAEPGDAQPGLSMESGDREPGEIAPEDAEPDGAGGG